MIKAKIERNNDKCKCECSCHGNAGDIEIELSIFVAKVIDVLSSQSKVSKNIITASIIQKVLIQAGEKNEINRNKQKQDL